MMRKRFFQPTRRRSYPLALLIAACLMASAAGAEPALTPHSAKYKLKISVLGGELQTRLEQVDDNLLATHTIKPTGMSRMISRGLIRESSEFAVTDDGVQPAKYAARDTLSRDKENVAIEFDWDSGKAAGTVNDEDVESVLESLSHDRVSIQYQLMLDLLKGATSAEYIMFEVDRLRKVSVRDVGHRTIDVPAGQYDAVGIQHQAEGSKRITTLWCVEELGFLPVVIEQHRNEKLRFRASLVSYDPIEVDVKSAQ